MKVKIVVDDIKTRVRCTNWNCCDSQVHDGFLGFLRTLYHTECPSCGFNEAQIESYILDARMEDSGERR